MLLWGGGHGGGRYRDGTADMEVEDHLGNSGIIHVSTTLGAVWRWAVHFTSLNPSFIPYLYYGVNNTPLRSSP